MMYSFLKLLHVATVIIFLGNLFTGLYWMHIAVKTKEPKIISHSIKGVIKSDRLFTLPGVLFITLFGLIAAFNAGFPILGTGWILWSIILFSISGAVFGWKVAPLQSKMYQLTTTENYTGEFNWNEFNKIYKQWKIWGLIALITPVAAAIMMTLKLPL